MGEVLPVSGAYSIRVYPDAAQSRGAAGAAAVQVSRHPTKGIPRHQSGVRLENKSTFLLTIE